MSQTRKPEIEDRIVAAARQVFAERGFAAASIADIAARAQISTGNVYRYFPGKDEVFAAAVPSNVVDELRTLVRSRVRALRGVADVGTLPPDAPYRVLSDQLLQFSIDHRLAMVIVLGRGEGTPYAGFAEELRKQLISLAVAHAASLQPSVKLAPATRFVLEQIYRGFLASLAGILVHYESPEDIRDAVERFSTYHLTGLARLFSTEQAKER